MLTFGVHWYSSPEPSFSAPTMALQADVRRTSEFLLPQIRASSVREVGGREGRMQVHDTLQTSLADSEVVLLPPRLLLLPQPRAQPSAIAQHTPRRRFAANEDMNTS